MAAASNKPGAVHYALIIFVMITVVLGIVTYQYNRSYSDETVARMAADEKLGKVNAAIKTYEDQVQVLKKLIGRNFTEIDDNNDPKNANTVKNAALNDMTTFGKEHVGAHYAETLQNLRQALDTALADRESKAGLVVSTGKDGEAEASRLKASLDTANKAQRKAESDKRDVISTQDERLAGKQEELNKLNQEKNALAQELAQEKEAREKDNKAKNQEITGLEGIIDKLRSDLNDLEKVSFEVPDGLIQRVDVSSKLVWINLGEADYLKPRMTFSVYGKENQGVGRGAEDVKGKIEVTRILGKHISEARMTQEDLLRPMVANDLLYTPLWSPGMFEKVAFIGLMDIDGDGKSDWEELKQLLAISGATVDTFVDDSGKRFPENSKITVSTKFLVRGEIPEPDQVLGSDEEKAKIAEIRKHLTDMTKEARASGVRLIKLSDFLAFMGLENKRRMFRPGQERPFNLKAGSTSTAVSEPVGDRSSSGNVSGSFGRKSAPQITSDGHTSKLFSNSQKP